MYLTAKQLSKNKNYEIIFLVGNYSQEKNIKYENIFLKRIFRLPVSESIFTKFIKSIKLTLIYIKVNPDIIITTSANAICGITAFYARLFNKKHIHRTAHKIDVDGSWIRENGIAGKIYNYGLKKADAIYVQNENDSKLLLENHNIKGHVIKNSFELKEKHYPKKEGVLWVARYKEFKQPEIFLKLSEKLPNYKFVMICPYEKEDKFKWLELKKSAEKLENLELIEKVPYPEIQNYFDESKVFVSTSTSEGFPNTFLQAALGKNVIVSLNVDPDKFLEKYKCGVSCNNKFEKLVYGTERYLKNEEERLVTAENLYKYLKENHDINKNVKLLENIILNIYG